MRHLTGITCIALILCAIHGLGYCDNTKALVEECYRKGNGYLTHGQYPEAQAEYEKGLALMGKSLDPRVEELKAAAYGRQLPVPALAPLPAPKALVKPAGTEPAETIPPQTPAPKRLEYLISQQDVLFLSVWQNSDLDGELIVRPDGILSVPLIGDVQAQGLTIPQLSQAISTRLAEYIKDPRVSLSIRKIGGEKVIILGEVKQPGVYSVAGAKTVLEAIGLAGGFTTDSVASSCILIRGGFSKPTARRLNLNLALKGDMSQNATLQSEDVLFIPKKFIADVNYALNQILDPLAKGAYTASAFGYTFGGK